MTVIAGCAYDGQVHMAADSLSSSYMQANESAEAKLFRVAFPGGVALVGCTTSWRFLQIMKYRLRPPVYRGTDPDEFMALGFSDAVRACMKKHGWKEGKKGGYALIGFAGNLYLLQDEFDITRPAYGYGAVGAGEDLALGAMAAVWATADVADVPVIGVRAACLHSPWCEEPIVTDNV